MTKKIKTLIFFNPNLEPRIVHNFKTKIDQRFGTLMELSQFKSHDKSKIHKNRPANMILSIL